MPTYVYKNLETGELYEFKQSMKDEAYQQHPETGAPIKRLISPPAIAFKGSGFYVTDSRGSGSSTTGSVNKTKNEPKGESAGAAAAPKSSGDSG